MTPNLKVILSAAGVAALVASPANARSHVRTHDVAPYGQIDTTPYAARQVVTPYGADTPTAPHETPGPSHDFELGGEK